MRGITGKISLWLCLGLLLLITKTASGGRFKIFGFKTPRSSRRNSQEVYRESLEEQTAFLERQLRAAKDESAQLRKLLKLSNSSTRKAKTESTRANKSMEQALREKLGNLQDQITKLQDLLLRAETLMEEESSKTKQLEELLNQERKLNSERGREYEQELAELQRSLLERSKEQLEELRALMEVRVKEAADEARREALEQVERKVKEATERVERQSEKKLQAEKKRSQQAVDRERAKMRKLVKALAEREKDLLKQTATNVDMTTTTLPQQAPTRPLGSSANAAATQKVTNKVASPYLP
jgi:DNA repair exonuclease SbcCD ATPase subunit